MMHEWEYMSAHISGGSGGERGFLEGLTQLGKDGWEAWAREERPDYVLVFFKRPKTMLLAPMITSSPEQFASKTRKV